MPAPALPILDLSLASSPSTKPAFLDSLRHALLDVGFLYISNTGIPPALVEDVIREGKAFFDLPEEEKLKIEMKNAPSFLGYSRLGNEITHNATDHREQLDLSTPHPLPSPGSPLYHNLLAPNQWPSPTLLPRFQPTYTAYLSAMSALSVRFTSLIAEAIGLPPTAFDRFFDPDQQHKLKLVKYPDVGTLGLGDASREAQGVGPHKDSMLSSYLLQATPQRGLQVLLHEDDAARAGEWIDVPPVEGTFVVAIGQGLEALTEGVCRSTTHRVLSPAAGEGWRMSVPFFQGVSYDAQFESMHVPDEVGGLRRREAGEGEGKGQVEMAFVKGRWGHLGEATLWNRVRSHQDVGERWYPELLKEVRGEREKGSEGVETAEWGVGKTVKV